MCLRCVLRTVWRWRRRRRGEAKLRPVSWKRTLYWNIGFAGLTWFCMNELPLLRPGERAAADLVRLNYFGTAAKFRADSLIHSLVFLSFFFSSLFIS